MSASIVARPSAIRSIAVASKSTRNAASRAFVRAPQAYMAQAPTPRTFGSSAVRNAKRAVDVSVNAASNGTCPG